MTAAARPRGRDDVTSNVRQPLQRIGDGLRALWLVEDLMVEALVIPDRALVHVERLVDRPRARDGNEHIRGAMQHQGG